jgi:hypothetical protein
MNKTVILILATVFFQALLWAVIVPVWHFPDEQAHFAQVQNYAEIGGTPPSRLDLSKEIAESELLLGTYRDERGNNQFTYNPTYRINYTDSRVGEHEAYLKQLPKETRTDFVRSESPRYPPLYYAYSAFWYQLFYDADLFTRIYAVRLGSIFLHLALVYAAFQFTTTLFPKSRLLSLSLTLAVAFHPMLMFVHSGINNDILVNLIAVLLLWQSIKNLTRPITLTNDWPTIILMMVGIFTKQLIYFLIPGILLMYLYRLLTHKSLPLPPILLSVLAFLFIITMFTQNEGFWQPFWPSFSASAAEFLSLAQVRLSQLYRETLPWYWGVYKWLGVVLPLWLLRTIKLFMVVALIGWVIKRPKPLKPWLALLIINLLYIGLLVIWDMSLTLRVGFGHGIQGRYFFPLIVSHMAFLIYGWSVITDRLSKKLMLPLTFILFLALNVYSLVHVSSQYYDHRTIDTYAKQVSQYKPGIAKWPALPVIGAGALLVHISLLYRIGKHKHSRVQ